MKANRSLFVMASLAAFGLAFAVAVVLIKRGRESAGPGAHGASEIETIASQGGAIQAQHASSSKRNLQLAARALAQGGASPVVVPELSALREAIVDPATRSGAINLSNAVESAVKAQKPSFVQCARNHLDVGFSLMVFRLNVRADRSSVRVEDARLLRVAKGQPLDDSATACIAKVIAATPPTVGRPGQPFLAFSGETDVEVRVSHRDLKEDPGPPP